MIIIQVNTYIGAFHDAVILYALALNESISEGADPRDGLEVTKRMWNRTFEGKLNPMSTIMII